MSASKDRLLDGKRERLKDRARFRVRAARGAGKTRRGLRLPAKARGGGRR